VSRIPKNVFRVVTSCPLASAFQSFMLGAGYPTLVPFWSRSFPIPTRLTSHSVLNSAGNRAWRPDGPTKGKCIWEEHGVWGWDTNKKEGVVLRENYFSKNPANGQKVLVLPLVKLDVIHSFFLPAQIDWHTDFYYPFLHKWANRIRKITSEEKIVFVEAIPNEVCLSPPIVRRFSSHGLTCSCVRLLGPKIADCRTWFMPPIGKILALLLCHTTRH